MPLSWNETKDRALKFSRDWCEASNEDADAKPFLVDFFNVFGISQRKVATFEHRVKRLNEQDGYIDMLWKGMLLVEMKSRGKNLDKAYEQAREYLHGLKEHELPKFIIVSDFENFRLYDLEEDKITKFRLDELVDNVQHFGFISGYQKKVYKEQDPANIKAAELMGKLHDRLKNIGYTGHPLEVYLVRLLFCLFADDTTIFNKQQFQDFIEQRTNEDGSDLAARLHELFQVLNTPTEQRFKNLDEQLAEFPYVNGKLFEEQLPMASFDGKMRQALLDCCSIDWARISPAIFGSMFQSVMNPVERRNLGAHYTSEKNILKVIRPLFLDELWNEFETIKDNPNKLRDFHSKISKLKFLDPACGCGNFLVIAYRELRMLELEILRNLIKSGQGALDVGDIIKLDVDMMYGIEIEEFPARIAEVAMWLIDHQMNMQVSNEFGQYFTRLPLRKSAHVHNADALKKDWNEVVSKDDLNYILGNPPFIGTAYQSTEQKDELRNDIGNISSFGMLDYVCGWFIKAARMIQDTDIKVAFVSTNSIVQGEQAIVLWDEMFNKYQVHIFFAHQTFKWKNEAKGNAAVHVVIIGLSARDIPSKILFEYTDISSDPHELKVSRINQYLIEGPSIILKARTVPVSSVPKIGVGSALLDGGNLILNTEDKEMIVSESPVIAKYIKRFWSAEEFIKGKTRWCLWLKNTKPEEINDSPSVRMRIMRVKEFRESSKRNRTHEMAKYPYLFGEERQPTSNFLIIPKVSSENRDYIPIGFMNSDQIITDKIFALSDANLFHFGIITSDMHMTWTKYVCGRLKSDFSYSNTIVYNNFPWPEQPTEKQVQAIEQAAQGVLDARAEFPNSSLADLYDPLTMPPKLLKAHQTLDKAVDLAYRPQPFTSDAKRMEYLFELYEKYTAGMFGERKGKKRGGLRSEKAYRE